MSPSFIHKKPLCGAFCFSIGCLGVSSFVGSVQYVVEDDGNIFGLDTGGDKLLRVVLKVLCKAVCVVTVGADALEV